MKRSISDGLYGKLLLLIIFAVIIGLFVVKIHGKNTLKNETGAVGNLEVSDRSAINQEVNQEPLISISPKIILPGDPILITISAGSVPVEILWDKKNIPIFTYDGKSRALVGVDFNEKVLKHEVKVRSADGEISTTSVTITPREKIEKPLGIPPELGGNTKEASKALINNLARENAEINNIKTETTPLWSESFLSPLSSLIVTDDYGYNRNTVGQTIVHKGTDFRAPVGTEVRAMNKGIVRIARTYIVYGNAVVIDHGLGLNTLYMHLSKINVKEGDSVEAGEVIGLSGKTGYVEAAHLHISVRVDKISIDPMTFLGFFPKK